ncbi:MAG: lysoplasmalogenase [Bacillus sp. (in: firmicutes)]
MNQKLTLFGFLVTAILFIFVIPTEHVWLRLCFKLLPMFFILFYVYSQPSFISKMYKSLILTGLIFCTLGDAFIIFSFTLGLVAFLIGHLFFIAAFLKHRHHSWNSTLSIILFVIYAGFFGKHLITALLANSEDSLVIPVLFYIVVITIMGWTATMTHNLYAAVGSILFVLSDSILAYSRFVATIPFDDQWIMLTYYGAQFFIAYSVRNYRFNRKRKRYNER